MKQAKREKRGKPSHLVWGAFYIILSIDVPVVYTVYYAGCDCGWADWCHVSRMVLLKHLGHLGGHDFRHDNSCYYCI